MGKTVDKDNWARKRKPEWMSTTGQIHFVRERQVPVVTPTKEEEIMPESRAVTPTKDVKAPAPAVTSVKKAEGSGPGGGGATSPGRAGPAGTLGGPFRHLPFV